VKTCTRLLCVGTLIAYPKLRFKDAAGNISSATLRLGVCGEHKSGPDVFLAQVNWVAIQQAHKKRYGIMPIYEETFLEWVFVDSDEGRAYEELLLRKEQGALIRKAAEGTRVAVEEVSEEEFRRLFRQSQGKIS
jgi:hypothetical protein